MSRKLFPWILFPDQEEETIFDIDYRKLKESGMEAVVFDLDNTIARWGEDNVSEQAIDLIGEIVDLGLQVGILTNSRRQKVRSFVEDLPYPCKFDARKPWRKNFLRLLDGMDVPPQKSVMIGDQLLTDVLGANLTSMYSIRVEPIEQGKEFNFTKFNRIVEKMLFSLRALFRILKSFKYKRETKDNRS